MHASTDLTPLQITVVQHIVAGATVAKAARLAGVHRSTIYLWRRSEPAFNAALEHYQGVLANAASERLEELVTSAFDALEECLNGPESTPATRFRAAAFILRHHASARQKSTHENSSPGTPEPPCDTLEVATNESEKPSSLDSDSCLRGSRVRPGFRARRRTHLPPQMFRVSRPRAADERPSSR